MRDRPAMRNRSGLTLIEALLAIVILGVGILALTEAASRCVAILRLTRNYHTARGILDQGELEYPIVRKKDEILNVEVEPKEYGNGYVFSRTAEENEEMEGLYVLRTTVSWSERGRNGQETVSALLYATNYTKGK